jgi:hypothetical protein
MKSLTMQWEKIFGINCLCAIVLMVTSCNESNVADLPEQKAFVLSETMMKMINLDTVIESQVQGVLNLNARIDLLKYSQ